MSQLSVQMFGGFAVTLDSKPVDSFRSVKARALLAYVAAQPDQAHSRSQLATLLWGDSSDKAARTNLRIELSKLKKNLSNHPAFAVSRTEVTFHSHLATIDTHTVLQAMDAFLALPVETQSQEMAQLDALLADHQGEFLAGLTVGDATDFEDWQLITREVLHERRMQALEMLQIRYAEVGRWAALVRVARRQLTAVPWAETAHRNVMQALAAQGKIGEALAQFEVCRQILQEELGVEPSAETQQFYQRLQNSDNEPTDQPASRPTQTASAPSVPQHNLPQHNLPQQLKRFIGRAKEVKQVEELIQHERLVTLLGLGGVGKSQLARTVAQRVLPHFEHGVWFVPLANIEATDGAIDQISLAIAGAIGLPLTAPHDLLDELTNHLQDRHLLLVLDNWDHLTAYAPGVLLPLLSHTPAHVLATSRLRLGLFNEVPVHIGGLPEAEAAALFLDRARRIVPGFDGPYADAVVQASASPDDSKISPDIQRICQLVDGLPLGVEIAASWVEHFSVAEIGQSIARTPVAFEVAPGQAHGLVQRHQGMSQLFEYSWRLLSPAQQQILARCALFRGGFDRDAAQAVAESSLSDLSILLGHSLIQRTAPGRYDLHPLIQEFTAFKLPEAEDARCGRLHSHHYLRQLLDVARSDWASHLHQDFENLRTAWQRAIRNQDQPIVAKTMVDFADFIAQYGLMADGNALFEEAVAQFEALQDGAKIEETEEKDRQNQENSSDNMLAEALNEMLAELLFQQWNFGRAVLGMIHSHQIQYRILALTDNPEKRIRSHLSLATHHSEMAEWEKADEHFQKVEALAKASPDPRAYISAVESRIHITAVHFRGQYKEGVEQLQEMLTLFESLPTLSPEEDPDGRRRKEDTRIHSQLYQSLALVAVRYRDYGLSIWACQQHLRLLDEKGMGHFRNWALLDLALAEQFAGLYEDAVAHNMEALAAAEESGAMDDVGLLQANLCLTLRQMGRLDEALERGREGAKVLRDLKLHRMEGQARNRIGHTLLAMARWAEAYGEYERSLVLWEPLNHSNRFEAVAGKALAAWRLGREAEALGLIEEVLAFVDEEGLGGIVEPLFLLLNCECVLREAGRVTEADRVLRIGTGWAETVTNRISDPHVRAAFQQRPDYQEMRARGEKIGHE